jgi:GTP cyclohydrolase IB
MKLKTKSDPAVIAKSADTSSVVRGPGDVQDAQIPRRPQTAASGLDPIAESADATSVSRGPRLDPIADVQATPDTRRLPIDKVGIKDIRHPVLVRDRSQGVQHTIATFNMYVRLPHNFKGTHMSRFVEILNAHDMEISVESFRDMLAEMAQRLEAKVGHIEMAFPYFIHKAAPVSGVKALMDYHVTFVGEVKDGQYTMTIKVIVPVTSLCPCSKEISERGAHNQRSHVTVAVRTNTFVWVEDLIDLIEGQASCELYGLLKRPDEKYVTERAYDNPKFVEDMVRDVAASLNKDERIDAYVVESENFESIHNHSAYAMIERDKAAAPNC